MVERIYFSGKFVRRGVPLSTLTLAGGGAGFAMMQVAHWREVCHLVRV